LPGDRTHLLGIADAGGMPVGDGFEAASGGSLVAA
jgi:hypothetical protein